MENWSFDIQQYKICLKRVISVGVVVVVNGQQFFTDNLTNLLLRKLSSMKAFQKQLSKLFFVFHNSHDKRCFLSSIIYYEVNSIFHQSIDINVWNINWIVIWIISHGK